MRKTIPCITVLATLLTVFPTLMGHHALAAGEMRVDNFGRVYAGDNPFPVGHIDGGTSAGELRVDNFGRVYSSGSPFPIGEIDGHTSAGTLRTDSFGRVYSSGSPFSLGDVNKEGSLPFRKP